jgi:hypothetical protein
LRKVHKAGYLHGNLQTRKLRAKGDDVFITGFGSARPKSESGLRWNEECEKELYILDSLLERLPGSNIPRLPDPLVKCGVPTAKPLVDLEGMGFRTARLE